MKTITLMTISLMMLASLSAQERTLISADIDHGGFGGMAYQLTRVNGDLAMMVGGHGGWIIGHTVYLGAAGYGMDGDFRIEQDWDDERKCNLGYGGLELGLIIASNRLLHLTTAVLLGGGGVEYRPNDWNGDFWDDSVADGFYVIEPSLHLILNVTRHFRLGAGVRYRHASGVDLEGLTDHDLSGPSASLIFKFGSF
jgi:hypothetical protein